MYLLQSRFEQTLEKLMAKNPNLDLSCLDDEDEPMEDAEAKEEAAEEAKGIEKVTGDVDMIAVSEPVVGSELVTGQVARSELEAEQEVAGST